MGLLRLSTDARQRFVRTFSLLGVLGGVAAVAVVAGRLANSSVFWASAGSAFFLACAALIAYAAKGLGVSAETADLLRANYASGEAVSQSDEPDLPPADQYGGFIKSERDDYMGAHGGFDLTADQEEWLAANVEKRGHSDTESPPDATEVDWIIQNLRRAWPPRELSGREWVRQHVSPAIYPDQELTAGDLAWLIKNITIVSEDEDQSEDEDR